MKRILGMMLFSAAAATPLIGLIVADWRKAIAAFAVVGILTGVAALGIHLMNS